MTHPHGAVLEMLPHLKTSIIKSLTSNSAATINNFLLNNLYCGIKSSFCKICRELLEWYTV